MKNTVEVKLLLNAVKPRRAKMINIEIDLGKHTMNVPWGMKKMFMDMLVSLEITQGNFKIHLGEKIKGGSQKGVKFVKLLPEFSAMTVKAQPSGRDGRHVCTIYFPDMFKNELTKYAKILKDNVGQEDFVAEEIVEVVKNIHKDVPQKEAAKDEELTGQVDEKVLARQQELASENEIFTVEMLSMIIADIFDNKGTGWISKNDLFRMLNALKLQCKTSRLIGKLLRDGYLEDDSKHPGERSRLTEAACLMIRSSSDSKIEIDEEDKEIIGIAKALKESNEAYLTIADDLSRSSADLGKLIEKDDRLKERYKRVVAIFEKHIEENIKKIAEKRAEVELISAKITPRMIEAHRRIQIFTSALPEE